MSSKLLKKNDLLHSLLLFAKSNVSLESQIIKKKLHYILQQNIEEENTLPWLINFTIHHPSKLYKISFPLLTIIILIFIGRDPYDNEKWSQLYFSIEIYNQIKQSIKESLFKLVICSFMLVLLLIFTIILNKYSHLLKTMIIFVPMLSLLLLARVYLHRLRKQTIDQISILYLIAYYFHPNIKNIKGMEILYKEKYAAQIINYINLGLDWESVWSRVYGQDPGFKISNHRELTLMASTEASLKLKEYSDKMKIYSEVFLQLFIVLIVVSGLLITFISANQIMKDGLGEDWMLFKASRLDDLAPYK